MPRWRIRLTVPEGQAGRQALDLALSRFGAREPSPGSPGPGDSEAAGHVLVDIADEAELGDLLHSLHELSPRVHISQAGGRIAGQPPARRR